LSNLFESAPSGRFRCRGSYGEVEMTLWFHPLCAAYKRPEPLLQALNQTTEGLADRDVLERAAAESLAHRRIRRVDGAERAPSASSSRSMKRDASHPEDLCTLTVARRTSKRTTS